MDRKCPVKPRLQHLITPEVVKVATVLYRLEQWNAGVVYILKHLSTQSYDDPDIHQRIVLIKNRACWATGEPVEGPLCLEDFVE